MRKIIASSVLATAALFPAFVHAENVNLPTNMAVEQKVEIRKGATDKYPLVTYLNQGQTVPVLDEFTNSQGEVWYNVDLGNKKGWGLAEYFETVTKTGTIQKGSYGIVSANNLNVRKGATSSYAVVTKLPHGQKVKVIDTFTNQAGELWYRIEIGSVKGWILSSYLSPAASESVKPPAPTQTSNVVKVDKAAVRKGATNSYAVVANLSKNQKVSVIDTFKNANGEEWVRVDLGSVKGWVIATAFQESQPSNPEPTPPTPSVELPKIGTYVLSLQNGTAVRKGATNSYAVATSLSQNQKVKVIDHFIHKNGEAWVRIDVGSVKGWVIATAVQEPKTQPSTPEPTPPTPNADLPKIGTYVFSQQNGTAVRKGATNSYAVATSLSQNQKVKVIDHFVHKNGEAWVRVQVTSSLAGWLPASSVGTAETLNLTLYISVDVANLRSGPSTNDSVVGQATKGTSLVAQKSEIGGDGNQWYQVLTNNKELAWVSETVVSKVQSEGNYVYAKKGAVVRKGATINYKVAVTLKENEPLLVVGTFNNWLNVETASGIRGWVEQSQISNESVIKLIAPSAEVINGDQYLIWKKPSNFKLTYETLSSSRLKIKGSLSDVELPTASIPGIKSVEKVANGAEQSVIITFNPGYHFTLRNYADKVTVKVVPNGLQGKKIILDAGHGNHDPGAVGPNGTKEKDVNLETALKLKKELENAGATVLLTRSSDVFLELSERTALANASDYDAFISIHADSFSSTSRGSTTYINTTVNFNGIRSKAMANAVQKNLVASLGTYNRGVKEQSFYVNRMNELPSILVELAFISNPTEEALLKSAEGQQKAAIGIAKGLDEYFKSF